jgi:hypothetical protein
MIEPQWSRDESGSRRCGGESHRPRDTDEATDEAAYTLLRFLKRSDDHPLTWCTDDDERRARAVVAFLRPAPVATWVCSDGSARCDACMAAMGAKAVGREMRATDGLRVTMSAMAALIQTGSDNEMVAQLAHNVADSRESVRDKVQAVVAQFEKVAQRAQPAIRFAESATAQQLLFENKLMYEYDSDDVAVALGSMLRSLGLQVRIIAVRRSRAEHVRVYLEVKDEAGVWFPVETMGHPKIQADERLVATLADFGKP